MSDLAELRKLAEAATPGPWAAKVRQGGNIIIGSPKGRSIAEVLATNIANRDSEFIAAASPDVVLALCDRLTEAEAILNDLAAGKPWIGCTCDINPNTPDDWWPMIDLHGTSCPWRRAVEWKGKQP